jgi:hypothetical protein
MSYFFNRTGGSRTRTTQHMPVESERLRDAPSARGGALVRNQASCDGHHDHCIHGGSHHSIYQLPDKRGTEASRLNLRNLHSGALPGNRAKRQILIAFCLNDLLIGSNHVPYRLSGPIRESLMILSDIQLSFECQPYRKRSLIYLRVAGGGTFRREVDHNAG